MSLWNRLIRWSEWIGRESQPRRRSHQAPRLGVLALEDRVTPSTGDCTGFLTYSQGGWSGSGTPGQFLDNNFASVFTNGIQIGDQTAGADSSNNTAGNWAAKFTTASAVKAYLPNGGGSSTLGGDFTNPPNPSGPVNGPGKTLGGQTLTMMLNVGFDAANPNFDGNSGNDALGSLIYNATDSTSVFNGKTVNQIIGYANSYLSGADTTTYSGSNLTAALDNIVQEFHEGALNILNGVSLTCEDDGGGGGNPDVTISGTKYEDQDGNLATTGDQSGISWTIIVNDGATSQLVSTDANGAWSFHITQAGTYTVTEQTQSGWTQLGSTTSYTITVDADGNVTSGSTTGNNFYNFDNYDITVHKFVDINGDGVESGGDGGVAGITINVWADNDNNGVYSAGDTLIGTGETDGSGNFTLTDIGPGNVVVTEDFSASAFEWKMVSSSNTAFQGSSGDNQSTSFGNILCNAGLAKTIGYWANNSNKQFSTIAELTTGLAEGGVATQLFAAATNNAFSSFTAFRSWILGVSAKNMNYMLSAQLAGAALNIGSGLASEYTLVTITATQDALINSATTFVNGQYVVQINDIIAEANAALASGGTKEYLGALKTILDNFNNMTNWYVSPLC